MFIIAGLGNPTKQYEGTRHNVGFEVIDRISEKYNIDVDAKKMCIRDRWSIMWTGLWSILISFHGNF